jgi:membrane protein
MFSQRGLVTKAAMERGKASLIVSSFLPLWKSLVLLVQHVWRRCNSDNCTDLAARVSFYFVLSLFPFFLMMAALIGWIPTTSKWDAFTGWLITYFPEDSRRLLLTNMLDLSRNYGRFLSLGLIVALWSASSGFYNLMQALTIAYRLNDTRSYLRRRVISVCATLLVALFLLICFFIWNLGHIVLALVSTDLHYVVTSTRLILVRWLLTLTLLWLGFDMLTYFLPGRPRPWRWFTPGAALTVLAFILGTNVFDFYVAHSSEISRIYGALAGFIVLMLWIYAANLALIVGAETDSVYWELRAKRT